jgi:serine/threonine-protein kinase HipA
MLRMLGALRVDIQGNRQSAAFEYHPSWLSSADSFAIEPGLPLLPGVQFHKQARDGSLFHGAIADTEPDGWARRVILRDHAKRRHEPDTAGKALALWRWIACGLCLRMLANLFRPTQVQRGLRVAP